LVQRIKSTQDSVKLFLAPAGDEPADRLSDVWTHAECAGEKGGMVAGLDGDAGVHDWSGDAVNLGGGEECRWMGRYGMP
jgi:hypothetical protein